MPERRKLGMAVGSGMRLKTVPGRETENEVFRRQMYDAGMPEPPTLPEHPTNWLATAVRQSEAKAIPADVAELLAAGKLPGDVADLFTKGTALNVFDRVK